MKKWFESREEIVNALKDAGYQLYGQNDNYAFIKPTSGIHNHFTMLAPYFHAILDHQYPLLNLHIDIPVFGGRHKTVQKDKRISMEMHRIRTKTFEGQLDLVLERFMGRLTNALK